MAQSISVTSNNQTLSKTDNISKDTDNFEKDKSITEHLDSVSNLSSDSERTYIRTISREIIQDGESSDKNEDLDQTKLMTDDTCENDQLALELNLGSQSQLIDGLNESASILKSVTDSDVSTVYIINPLSGYIIKVPENSKVQQICDSWKIGSGTIIAAHTAATKQFIITDDIYADTRFPEGIGSDETLIQCAMTVPITTPNDELKGILEFARIEGKNNYTSKELNTVLAAATWIGNSVFYSEMYYLKMKQLSMNQHLMKITKRHTLKFVSLTAALIDVMTFGKSTFEAFKSTFFLINTENKKELYADCYEEFIEDDEFSVKKRNNVLITAEVVKRAVTSKLIINESDMKFEQVMIDKTTDENPEKYSTLCLPIVRDKKTLGVYQLINKSIGNYFTNEDELLIQDFSTYFTLLIDLKVLKAKFDRKGHEVNVNNEVLLYHINPCKHEEELLMKQRQKLPENFMTFAWYPTINHLDRFAELTLVLFRETLGENFMKVNNMYRFILTVQKCYRPNPYHNFEHAFTVTHTMANIICRNRDMFSDLEKEALMISTICHDLDHRGFTNNFIQMTDHPISKLYQGSPMENHHFFMTQKIMEQCEMFTYMSSEALSKIMKEIYDDIIFTDLSIYFLSRLQLVEALKKRQFSWDEDKCRYLVKGILMTACDLSAQTKAYHLSKRPTYGIYKEFFNQGDIEKQMGLTPLPTMNRENASCLPENQVQFINLIIMPCYHIVATLFPNTYDLFQGCRNLRGEWKELIKAEDRCDSVDFSELSFLPSSPFHIRD